MDNVIDVSKQEIEISRKKDSDWNLKKRLRRMVRDDEGFSEDEIPRNIARHQKYTRDDIDDTREPMRFKRGSH